MLVEVCANSLESALNAEKAGADRIELLSELQKKTLKCSIMPGGGINADYAYKFKEKGSMPFTFQVQNLLGP